ncbi:MAG: hypothetical protein V4719_27720 [Planctomycetota bacterium]
MTYPPLDREEYIEQTYFFRTYRERLEQNMATQDILAGIHEEILSTTRLPMAIDFLRGEILLNGRLSEAMDRLPHYFAPFQAYVFSRAEEDKSRFDQLTALLILEREADYRANAATPAGLFVYQFECLSRNRLGYDKGLQAMLNDPLYSVEWRAWIQRCRRQLGSVDFADLIYFASEQYLIDQRRRLNDPELVARTPLLFGPKEGRIARANQGKDPLYMFAAFQRQLGYPTVPRPPKSSRDDQLSPASMNARLVLLEKRVALLDAEVKGDLQLDQFYAKKTELPMFPDDPTDLDSIPQEPQT